MKHTSSFVVGNIISERESDFLPLDVCIHVCVYVLHKKNSCFLKILSCKILRTFVYVGKSSSFVLNWLYCILKSAITSSYRMWCNSTLKYLWMNCLCLACFVFLSSFLKIKFMCDHFLEDVISLSHFQECFCSSKELVHAFSNVNYKVRLMAELGFDFKH